MIYELTSLGGYLTDVHLIPQGSRFERLLNNWIWSLAFKEFYSSCRWIVSKRSGFLIQEFLSYKDGVKRILAKVSDEMKVSGDVLSLINLINLFR